MIHRSSFVLLLGLAFVGVVAHAAGTGQVCTQPVSLGIAIDESGSIAPSDFTTVRDQIADFITSTSATTPGNQYYFNVFSNAVRSPMTGLKPNVNNDVADLVRGLSQVAQGTNMAAALDDLALKLSSGHLAILFTDGYPNDAAATTTAASNLKAKGVTLITIGIGGGVDKAFLDSIASPGYSFIDPNFDQLNAKLNEALVIACPCPSCVSNCAVRVRAVSVSKNEAAIVDMVDEDIQNLTMYVCQDVNGVLPPGLVINNKVEAFATATATATAHAVAKVLGRVWMKGNCDVGSGGRVKLSSTAVAWANVTAKAYAKAISEIVGKNAQEGFHEFVEAEWTALASACEKAIVKASAEKFFAVPVGASYPEWTRVLRINKSETIEATATAIATAYIKAVTRFKTTAASGELACSARCDGCEDIVP